MVSGLSFAWRGLLSCRRPFDRRHFLIVNLVDRSLAFHSGFRFCFIFGKSDQLFFYLRRVC